MFCFMDLYGRFTVQFFVQSILTFRGSASEDERAETVNDTVVSAHVPVDPNSAMDTTGPSDAGTADMLKTLHG